MLCAQGESNQIRNIVTVEAPLFPELKSSLVLQKINQLKQNPKNKDYALLTFVLGAAYYEEGRYRQAYDALKGLKSLAYLDDYLKYYTAMSVLKYSQSANLLSKNMDLLYSLFNKGNGALAAELKSILPEYEFKIARAFIDAGDYRSSLDYYTRARTRGYSSLKEEFDLVQRYLRYDKLIAKSFMLDLARNFPESEVRELFEKLPIELRDELYVLSAYDSARTVDKIKTD
jgi:tetratricopeptide (TPR) repeat protein